MTTFVNGGAFYPGIQFTTGIELLNLLLINLPTEGWEIVLDDIVGSSLLLVRGTTSNNHTCHIRFSFSANQFQIRGDLLGDGAIISPSLSLEFDVTPGDINRLWLTFDNDSGALAIKGNRLYKGGFSWGFYDRVNTSDQDAWHIAKLNNRLLDCYVARTRHDNVAWASIGSRFFEADQFGNTDFNGPVQGIIDYMAVKNPWVNYFNTNVRNAGYSAYRGALEQDNDKPVITNRFYVEGRGSDNDYDTSNNQAPLLYYRGRVKHVVNGFGAAAMGRKEKDSLGRVFLSTGDTDLGWQGLQIDQVAALTSTELPTVFRRSIGFVTGDNYRTEFINSLKGANWTVSAQTTLRSLFQATHTDNSSLFYLRSAVNNGNIELNGSVDISETNLSPTLQLPFGGSVLNHIWITANSQAGCICVKNGSTQGYTGVWFGFLRGAKPRFGIGYINSNLSQSWVYEPISKKWRSLDSGFVFTYDDFSSFPTNGMDRLTTSLLPARFFSNVSNNRNSAINAYNGRVNGVTNDPALSFFGITEGFSSILGYGLLAEGENIAPRLKHLGTVEFLATGMASSAAGTITTSSTGVQFLSTGGTTWQAMRISQ